MSVNNISFSTAAGTISFSVSTPPVTVAFTGLAGVETVGIDFDIDGSYEAVTDESGDDVTITASVTSRTIDSPGKFRITKPTSAGAVKAQVAGNISEFEYSA